MKKFVSVLSLCLFPLLFFGCYCQSKAPWGVLSDNSGVNALIKNTVKVEINCFGRVVGHGTGVILGNKDGNTFILTAAHVAEAPGDAAAFCFLAAVQNGSKTPLMLKKINVSTDLAVLSYKCTDCKDKQVKTRLASSHRLAEPVIAIGHQAIQGFPAKVGAVTYGVSIETGEIATEFFSGTGDKKVLRLLRVTAAFNNGDSGGGVYNKDGHLIGVMSFGNSAQSWHLIVPYNKVEEITRSLGLYVD